MDVGIEGHEWEVEDDEEMKATQNKHLVIDVSDNDDEIAPVQKKNDSRGKSWRLLRVTVVQNQRTAMAAHTRDSEANDVRLEWPKLDASI